MSDLLYYTLCGVSIVAVLLGISAMSKVTTALKGNTLSALATVFAMALIFATQAWTLKVAAIIALFAALGVGTLVGIYGAAKAKVTNAAFF